MTIGTFLSTLAAFLGFGASVFFVIGSVRLSNKAILELATPYWDYHSEIAKTYAEQKWLYTFGALLLILAFIAQVVSLAPLDLRFSVAMSPGLGFIIAGVIAVALWVGAYFLSAVMTEGTVKAVDQMSGDQITQGEEEDRAAKNDTKSH